MEPLYIALSAFVWVPISVFVGAVFVLATERLARTTRVSYLARGVMIVGFLVIAIGTYILCRPCHGLVI